MIDLQVPVWGWGMIAAFLVFFLALVGISVKRNRGIKRSLFASPYTLWMIVFTVVPILLIAYYAMTDANGNFTLDNFRNFWDSNYSLRQRQLAKYGAERLAQRPIPRGTVNIDTLVYSLWMALSCTILCLLAGYPAALFMADRKMKLGSTLVVLFIIPMWMNFLLRTIAWMALL